MKIENKELINKQMIILKKEIEDITDIGKRAEVRVGYIDLLWRISTSITDIPEGKESIKNNYAKYVEETEEDDDDEKELEEIKRIQEDNEELDEEEYEEESLPINIEDDEEPDPLQNSEVVEQIKTMIVTDDEGNEIDITDIYNKIIDIDDEEEKIEIAKYIYECDECIDEYNSLTMLSPTGNKAFIASCIKIYGIEAINNCVDILTEGEINDLYEYINDNNLDGFSDYIEKIVNEEEE